MKYATLLTLTAMLCATSFGATYAWTGTVSTDWNKVGNWDANGIPTDSNAGSPGLDFSGVDDQIVFNAANVPTLNLPGVGSALGGYTPEIELTSGGTSCIASSPKSPVGNRNRVVHAN
ncbi:MAG: hypothetical protein V3V05_08340 [Pontiella sp.]